MCRGHNRGYNSAQSYGQGRSGDRFSNLTQVILAFVAIDAFLLLNTVVAWWAN